MCVDMDVKVTVGEVREERAGDGGMDGCIEEGAEERRGTGETGVEGLSL